MSKPQLEKATITVLDGADKGKVITVLFNPTEYSFDRTNSYKATPVPGLGSPLLQFVNGECDQLSMELFLDDYTDPEGPTSLRQKEQEPVAQAAEGDLASCSRSTATCTRRRRCASTGGRWNSRRSSRSSGRKVTMFHPDGTPARATLSVTLQGIPHAAPAARGAAPRVGRQDQAPRGRRPRQRCG